MKVLDLFAGTRCNYSVDISTTYNLIDINGKEEELVSTGEDLSSLKDFIESAFDYQEEFNTKGLLFKEVQERLEGIGYRAEETV